jgi:succinate dehydrogenase/fumarate reductase cytochrome b subunit
VIVIANSIERTDKIVPWLKRVSRASAWLLLVGVIVLIVSGWGITQTGIIYKITFGLIDRRLADNIHRATNVPLAIFFLTHVLINIKLAISRYLTSMAWAINAILILIGAGLLAIMVYMEWYRLGG